jgi:hypothetical protein
VLWYNAKQIAAVLEINDRGTFNGELPPALKMIAETQGPQ